MYNKKILILLWILKLIEAYNQYFFPVNNKIYLELPYISYETGIQHIHTPELFLPSVGLVPYGFNIDSYEKPFYIEDDKVLDITYSTYFTTNSKMRFFTPEKSKTNILYYENNMIIPYMMANVNVIKKKSIYGHIVNVDITVLKEKDFVRNFCYMKDIKKTKEDIITNLPPTGKDSREENLLKYIKMIMK